MPRQVKDRKTARAKALTGTVLYFHLDVPEWGSKGIARAYVPIPEEAWRAFSAAARAGQLDRASAIMQPFSDRQTSAFGVTCSLRLPESRRKELFISIFNSLEVYGTLRHVNVATGAIDVDSRWLTNIYGT